MFSPGSVFSMASANVPSHTPRRPYSGGFWWFMLNTCLEDRGSEIGLVGIFRWWNLSFKGFCCVFGE